MKTKMILKFLLGFMILMGAILYRGFYTLNEREAALVVEYETTEIIGEPLSELAKGKLEKFRADLIALIYEQHSGGKARIVRYGDPPLTSLTPSGNLYWHLPPPFGKHYKIDLEIHNYHLGLPLIYTVATDHEDRPLLYYVLTPDVDGDPSTEDLGFRLISAHDLFDIQFSPEAELVAMMLRVKGQFKINNLENYALWIMSSYGQMDKIIEEHGFFGEIVGGPYGDDLIEAYLSSILDIYVWNRKYPALLQTAEEEHPEMPPSALEKIVATSIVENPESLTDGFVNFLTSQEFVNMTGINLVKGVGIEVSEKIETEIYEGSL